MASKKFLLLQSNVITAYTLGDIEHQDNVVLFHRKKVSDNKLLNLLYIVHNSGKIAEHIQLPFKGVWDKILFNKMLKSFVPDYIIITTSWYSDHLIAFFRTQCPRTKIIFRFTDTVANGLGGKENELIQKMEKQLDGVLVYSKEDAEKYGFCYHSVGYSAVNPAILKHCPQYDVVFIGASKGRMDKIRHAYNTFVSEGLSCFFYVILVDEKDRKNDGIIYGDSVMPFLDYLAYEINAKCLFELVQEGSTGRTFRLMESIIYNKLLITNCEEIKNTDYYNP